jgi:hypothetical protein
MFFLQKQTTKPNDTYFHWSSSTYILMKIKVNLPDTALTFCMVSMIVTVSI